MADYDGSMKLRDRETEEERKQRQNSCSGKEGSRVGNEERAHAGLGSSQGLKVPVKRARRTDGRRTKYDAQGIHRGTHKDLCDCLNPDCPGCWMPCKKCSSTKCGHECRRNRRWEYDNIHIQGTSINIENQPKK